MMLHESRPKKKGKGIQDVAGQKLGMNPIWAKTFQDQVQARC